MIYTKFRTESETTFWEDTQKSIYTNEAYLHGITDVKHYSYTDADGWKFTVDQVCIIPEKNRAIVTVEYQWSEVNFDNFYCSCIDGIQLCEDCNDNGGSDWDEDFVPSNEDNDPLIMPRLDAEHSIIKLSENAVHDVLSQSGSEYDEDEVLSRDGEDAEYVADIIFSRTVDGRSAEIESREEDAEFESYSIVHSMTAKVYFDLR